MTKGIGEIIRGLPDGITDLMLESVGRTTYNIVSYIRPSNMDNDEGLRTEDIAALVGGVFAGVNCYYNFPAKFLSDRVCVTIVYAMTGYVITAITYKILGPKSDKLPLEKIH
jgi:phage shock protein PspC (stress-responsive transcriptional regulator)